MSILLFFSIFLLLDKFIGLNIYVRERGNITQPNGTFEMPFNNIIQAIIYINDKTFEEEFIDILVPDYLTIMDDNFLNETQYFANNGNNKNFYNLFDSRMISKEIRMLPAKCEQFKANINECQDLSQILLKTQNFTFNVFQKFTIWNIVFNGNDLNLLYNVESDAKCYFSSSGCCTEENKLFDRCMRNNTNILGLNYYYFALFTLKSKFASLTLKKNVFKNFNTILRTNTIVSIVDSSQISSATNITFENVQIYSSYFFQGIAISYGSYIRIIDLKVKNNNPYNILTDYNLESMGYYFNLNANTTLYLENSIFQNHDLIMSISESNAFIRNSFFEKHSIIDDFLKYSASGIILIAKNSKIEFESVLIVNNDLENMKDRRFFYLTENTSLVLTNCQIVNNSISNDFFFIDTNNIIILNSFIFYNNTKKYNSDSILGYVLWAVYGNTISLLNFSILNILMEDHEILIGLRTKNNFNCQNCKFSEILMKNNLSAFGFIFYIYFTSDIYVGNSSFREVLGGMTSGIILFDDFLQTNQIIFANNIFSNIYGEITPLLMFTRNDDLNMTNCIFEQINGLIGVNLFYFEETYNNFFSNLFFRKINLERTSIFENSGSQKAFFYIRNSAFINITLINLSQLLMLRNNNLKVLNLTVTNIILINSMNFNIIISIFYFEKIKISEIYGKQGITLSFYFEQSQGSFSNIFMKNLSCNSFGQKALGAYFNGNNTITFSECFFTYILNANDNAGLFFLGLGNKIFFSKCYFKNNSVNDYSGGSIYADIENNLFFDDCIFNLIRSGKGSIYSNSRNFVTLTKIKLYDIYSKYGSVLYSDKDSSFKIMNSTFLNVASEMKGGLFYGRFQNEFILESSFLQNHKSGYGAIIYSEERNLIYINRTFLQNITVESSGSLIHADNNNLIKLFELNIIDAFSNQGGGIICLNERNDIFLEKIKAQKMEANSGAFLFSSINNLIEIDNMEIDWSRAQFGGAFLFEYNNQIKINKLIIRTTEALQSGGFMMLLSENNLTLSNLNCFSSVSEIRGGFLYAIKINQINLERLKVIKVECLFKTGGFVHLESGNKLNLTFSFINESKSMSSGGTFYLGSTNHVDIFGLNTNYSKSIMDSGGFIFSHFSNFLNLKEIQLYCVSSNLEGGVLFFFLLNTLMIKVLFINVIDIVKANGCLLYSENQNNINIWELEINDSFSHQNNLEGYFIYMNEENNFYLKQIRLSSKKIKANSFFVSIFKNSFKIENLAVKTELEGVLFNFNEKSLLKISKFTLVQSNDFSFLRLNDTKFECEEIYLKVGVSGTAFSASFSFLIFFKFKIIVKFYGISTWAVFFYSHCILKNGIISFYSKSRLFNGNNCIVEVKETIFMNSLTDEGVFKLLDSDFILFRTIFLKNNALKSGGVAFLKNNKRENANHFSASKSIHLFNKAAKYGGVFDLYNISNLIQIKRNIFKFNQAVNGGAFSLTNIPNLTSYNSIFYNNVAKLSSFINENSSKGACFYLKFSKINLLSNNFTANTADIGSLVYHDPFSSISSLFSFFSGNRANFYGDTFASPPISVIFSKEYPSNPSSFTSFLHFANLVSGKTYSYCLAYLVGFDLYYNLAYNSAPSEYSSIIFNSVSSFQQNLFNLSFQYGFPCFAGPFTRLSLPIEGTFSYKVEMQGEKRKSENLLLILGFRGCVKGEMLNKNNICVECKVGEFSFRTTFENDAKQGAERSSGCLPCDYQPFNCLGGFKLTPKPTYSRLSIQSTNFLKCPIPESCLGGRVGEESGRRAESREEGLGECEEGYEGVLCYKCKKGWGRGGGGKCLNCKGWIVGITVFLQIFLRGGIMIWVMWIGVRGGGENGSNSKIQFEGGQQEENFDEVEKKMKAGSIIERSELIEKKERISKDEKRNEEEEEEEKVKEEENASEKIMVCGWVLKIVVGHVQMLGAILRFRVEIPRTWMIAIGILENLSPGISESIYLECILDGIGWEISPFYFKLMITLLYPILIIMLCCLFITIIAVIQNKNSIRTNVDQAEGFGDSKDEGGNNLITNKARESNPKNLNCLDNIKIVKEVDEKNLSYFENLKENEKRNFILSGPNKLDNVRKLNCRNNIFSKIITEKDIEKRNYLKWRGINIFSYFTSFFFIAFLFCYYDNLKVLLEFIEYINVGDAEQEEFRLVQDLEIRFFDEKHLFWVKFIVIPLILLIGIVIPFFIFAFLLFSYMKSSLDNKWIKFNLGFFYFAYKKKLFFWDFVILFRKILIIFAQSYFFTKSDKNEIFPPIFLLFVIFICLLLQVIVKPFQPKAFGSINSLEKLSLITIFFSFYIALFYQSRLIMDENQDYYVNLIFFTLEIVLNSFFLFKSLIIYFEHNETIRRVVSKGLLSLKSNFNYSFSSPPKSKKADFLENESPVIFAFAPIQKKFKFSFNNIKLNHISAEEEIKTNFESFKSLKSLKKMTTLQNDKIQKISRKLKKKWTKNCMKKNCVGIVQDLTLKNKSLAQRIGFELKITDLLVNEEKKSSNEVKLTHQFLEEDLEFMICSFSEEGIYSDTEEITLVTKIEIFGPIYDVNFIKMKITFTMKNNSLNSCFDFDLDYNKNGKVF